MNQKPEDYRVTGLNSAGTGTDGAASPGRLKTFESLRNPVYRIYYAAMAGHWFGFYLLLMARSLLIYRLTGSGAIIGVMSLALALPALLVQLFGGALADRIQKKYLMIIGATSEAVITLIVASALQTGYLSVEHAGSWWLLIVAAGFQGITAGFTQPALISIIPEIVSKEQVMNGISLNTMLSTAFRLIGPAVCGFLIDAYGFALVYYCIACLYTTSAVLAFFIPRTSKPVLRKGNVLSDVAEGFRYIRGDTAILLIVIFGLLHFTSGQPYSALMPMFTEDILKVGATGLGILSSVSSVGALVASFVVASLPNRKRGVMLLLSGVIMGLSILGFCWSRSWYLSLGIVPFVGVGMLLYTTMSATVVQSYVPPDYRGRMQAFVGVGTSLSSVGTFLAGVLADVIGAQWSVASMAILITLVSLGYLSFAHKVTCLE